MAIFNGTSANEVFIGGSADDTADGAGGNDTLKGGDGTDRLYGGAGADLLEGGLGNDFLASYAADFNFSTYPYSNSIPLDTFAELDSLAGGDGDDYFSAGFGDTVNGGVGRDGLIISFQGATAGVSVDFSQLYTLGSVTVGGATISNIEGVPYIEGSEFDDYIVGHNGDYFDFSRIYGRGGNDHLVADYKAWILDGGDGDDLLDGRYSGYLNSIVGGSGNDTILVSTSSWATISGGSGADKIDAGSGAVHGDGGNDTINAFLSSYGEAQVHGDAGNDRLNGGDGTSYLFGGSGADRLYGNAGDDILRSGLGSVDGSTNVDNGLEKDQLFGGIGNDDIGIGYGDDANGGFGDDRLSISLAGAGSGVTFDSASVLGAGAHSVFGGTISNMEVLRQVTGTAFNDVLRIRSQGADATVNAGAGNDTITTDEVAVTINGQAGNDLIINGAGADIMDGGSGVDTLDYRNSILGVIVAMGAGAAADWGSGPGGDVFRNIENITGSAHDDSLTGGAGANALKGAGGDDVLEGGLGADRLDGGAGIDTASYAGASGGVRVSLAITGAQDTVSAGTDTLVGIEKLIGSAFGDVLKGTAGQDDLSGNAGDDVLQGGLGDNLLNGGDGQDSASYADATNAMVVDLALASGQASGWGNDTLISIEGVVGSAYADTIYGDGGDNIIEGGAGNDVMDGRNGIDTLSYRSAAAAVNVTLALTDAQNTGGAGSDRAIRFENLLGSRFDDTLNGSAGANRIDGDRGNDTIWGRGGTDTLNGGAGDDLIYSDTGDDFIDGGEGSGDTLSYAKAGSAVTVDLSLQSAQATGGAGMDSISGIEILVGSNYGDTIRTSDTADQVNAGNGNDTVWGGSSGDILDGGAGIDTLSFAGSTGHSRQIDLSVTGVQPGAYALTISGFENVTGSDWVDVLVGDAGANVLDGQESLDYLYGRAGNDTLIGGSGDDQMRGGTGNDILIGGEGADAFFIEDALVAANVDVIDDFNVSEDTFILGRFAFAALPSVPGIEIPLAEGAFRIGTAAADFDDRIIYNSTTGQLLYDADGIGLLRTAVHFATVDPGLALTAADFVVL